MFKLFVFLTIFGIINVIISAKEAPNSSKASIEIVEDINEFKAKNPRVHLEEMKVSSSARNSGRYTLGSRVSGDRLIATTNSYNSYGTPQNIELTLTYPTRGTGAIVTQVIVDVQQSSRLGRGYVVSGGIGQRFIKIVIEAYSSTYFGHNSYIYGF